jgi:hypothetical protein
VRRRLFLVSVAACAAAGAAAVPAPADSVVAMTARPTPLAAWGGVLVWSAWDSTAGGYRLMARTAAGVAALPVAPRPVPFDADVGPGPDGGPVIVYSRCPTGWPPWPCQLFQVRPG